MSRSIICASVLAAGCVSAHAQQLNIHFRGADELDIFENTLAGSATSFVPTIAADELVLDNLTWSGSSNATGLLKLPVGSDGDFDLLSRVRYQQVNQDSSGAIAIRLLDQDGGIVAGMTLADPWERHNPQIIAQIGDQRAETPPRSSVVSLSGDLNIEASRRDGQVSVRLFGSVYSSPISLSSANAARVETIEIAYTQWVAGIVSLTPFGTAWVDYLSFSGSEFEACTADIFPAGGDGLLDLSDITAFVEAFLSGCP